MYDGWVWRKEREEQDRLGHTFLLLKAWGSEKLKFETLLGRSPYPVLRALQVKPTRVGKAGQPYDDRTREEKLAEVEELKKVFAKELAGDVSTPTEDTGEDLELFREAGIDI